MDHRGEEAEQARNPGVQPQINGPGGLKGQPDTRELLAMPGLVGFRRAGVDWRKSTGHGISALNRHHAAQHPHPKPAEPEAMRGSSEHQIHVRIPDLDVCCGLSFFPLQTRVFPL